MVLRRTTETTRTRSRGEPTKTLGQVSNLRNVTLEPDVPELPGAIRADERRLRVDRFFGYLHQLAEQFGSPGPSIHRPRDGRVVVAIHGDLTDRHEAPTRQA